MLKKRQLTNKKYTKAKLVQQNSQTTFKNKDNIFKYLGYPLDTCQNKPSLVDHILSKPCGRKWQNIESHLVQYSISSFPFWLIGNENVETNLCGNSSKKPVEMQTIPVPESVSKPSNSKLTFLLSIAWCSCCLLLFHLSFKVLLWPHKARLGWFTAW